MIKRALVSEWKYNTREIKSDLVSGFKYDTQELKRI